VVEFKLPECVLNSRPAAAFAHLSPLDESLTEGLDTNIDEIRSAVMAIPSHVISVEAQWMRLACGLAFEGRVFKKENEMWEILDAASKRADNYNKEKNLLRFQRYMKGGVGLEDPITTGTVFRMAAEHGWKGWSPPLSPAAPVPIVWSAADLQVSFSNIPHRRWLYGTYLIRGEITVLAAPGGAGKTALATGIAVEIAAGIALLDENIFGTDLKVLLINGEDGGIEIQRRIWALDLAYAHKNIGQNLERLYVAGANDRRVQRLSFLQSDRNFSTLDQSGLEVLESALDALRPDVLILDPLVVFCGGGNMNDSSVMSQVMRELKRLATKFDCAALIVHHTRKGADKKGADDGNAEAVSGSAAIVNLARRAIMPVPMTEKEALGLGVAPAERSRYFKLVDAKSNFAPRSTDCPWYRLNSVPLPNAEPPVYPNGDNVQAIARVTLPLQKDAAATADDLKIKRALLHLIDRGKIIDGKPYPYSPSLAGAKNERGLLRDAIDIVRSAMAVGDWRPADFETMTKHHIATMMKDGWLVGGAVEELTSKPGRFRKGRGLKVVWGLTPWPSVGNGTAASDGTKPDGGQLVN
jgi:AAA domain